MARTTTSPEFSPTRILTHGRVRAPHLVRVRLHALLHPECRVACPHCMVLMGQRRAEQRHDPVAHHLVDGALVAVDGLHHPLEDGVEKLAGLLGVAVGEQLHRALQVGEEHRDLLALALERGLRGEDLLGEVLGRVAGRESNRGPVSGRGLDPLSGARTSCRTSRPADLRRRTRAGSASRAPHSSQNRRRRGSRAWHRGHVMAVAARLRPGRSHPCRQAERAA